MTAALGTEFDRQVSFPITDSDIRRWAVAVYFPEEPPRLFWDRAYAAGTAYGGIVAPEEFNPFAWMRADPAGLTRGGDPDPNSTEKMLGIEPPSTRFVLNGGMEDEYGVRMRPGDVITLISKLGAYHERNGRLGLMLFTVIESTWTNQRRQPVRYRRYTRIRY